MILSRANLQLVTVKSFFLRETYPTPLETVLRAEETVGAHLQAGRTLERACILLAVHTDTFPRCDSGHGDLDSVNGPTNCVVSRSNLRLAITKVPKKEIQLPAASGPRLPASPE
jgi:hypothetical protein